METEEQKKISAFLSVHRFSKLGVVLMKFVFQSVPKMLGSDIGWFVCDYY